jgi:membrane-associated HD superfamily phosphohydrolase
MAFGLHKRSRFERVSSLELPPGQWERAWVSLRRRDVLGRIGLALLTAASLCSVIRGWNPPFTYRLGHIPSRDIVANVPFSKLDPVATQAAQQEARRMARHVYSQDSEPLVQLRAELRNTLASSIAKAPTLDKLDPKFWREFQLPASLAFQKRSPPVDPKLTTAEERAKQLKEEQAKREKQYKEFHDAVTQPESLDRVNAALDDIFAQLEDRGLLVDDLGDPGDKDGKGNLKEIVVYTKGCPNPADKKSQHVLLVSSVLRDGGSFVQAELHKRDIPSEVADRLSAWIQPRLAKLKSTLQHDKNLTEIAKKEAEAAVPDVRVEYAAGQTLAPANKPLDKEQIELLALEYAKAMHGRPISKMIARSIAVTGSMFVAMLLCGIYMRYRQRGPLASLTRLLVLMLLSVVVVGAARWCGLAEWPTELMPVLLFGMMMAIVYRQELALLLTGTVTIAVVMALGHGIQEFVLLMGVTTAAVLNLGNIRNRSKLIYVGLFAGFVAVVLRLCLGIIDDQPFDRPLWRDAIINGAGAVAAGFIILGLLPFIEHFSAC